MRTALNRVESTGRRARHYREVVLPAREKALAETWLQYNAMQVSVFQVLESQRQGIAANGGEIPAAARHPETTVLVPVGSTRVSWYQHPKGTVADRAEADRRKRDGIDPDTKFGGETRDELRGRILRMKDRSVRLGRSRPRAPALAC